MLNLSNISSLCIPIVAAILGIAMPIIVQTIAGIDTKYNSLRLVKRFKSEVSYKRLWFSLISTILILVVEHFLSNDSFFLRYLDPVGIKIYQMSEIFFQGLSLISTIYLIGSLFVVIILIVKYYDYKELFDSILGGIKVPKESKCRRTFHKWFRSSCNCRQESGNNLLKRDIEYLTELVKYCIMKNDDETINDYYQYMSDYVDGVNKKGGEVKYDQWFYDVVLELNNFICTTDNIPYSMVNRNVVLDLLIPNDVNIIISERTYQVLWGALNRQLRHRKDDMVYRYWEHAYTYSTLILRPIRKKYIRGSLDVVNQTEIDNRTEQIDRFKEFNFALGGYILYMEEYDLIADVLNLDSGYNLETYLLPSLFYDIVESYRTLYSFSSQLEMYFLRQYPFYSPRSSINPLVWAKRFLLLLLFRLGRKNAYNQYVNDPWMYHFGGGLSYNSNLKDIFEEMNRVLMHLDKEMVRAVIRKSGLYEPNDSVDEIIKNIKDKLDSFISEIDKTIEKNKVALILSDSEKKKFDNSTLNIITENSFVYKSVLNECISEKETLNKDTINTSLSRVFSKESFADESTKTIVLQDSVMAEGMVLEFNHLYSMSYYKNSKRYFKVDSDDMFKAIDYMIGNKLAEYVVVNFGYYLDYRLKEGPMQVVGLKKGSVNEYKFIYKDKLDIYSVPSPGNGLMDYTFVLIKKDDLPCYISNVVPKELENKYKLGRVESDNNDLNIYTSILFNNFPDEHKRLESPTDCLATIYYSIQLCWKKNADLTILKSFSKLVDSGVATPINELPKL